MSVSGDVESMDGDEKEFPGEVESEENFEQLLNMSGFEPGYFHPGERIEARVIKITKEWVFIEAGAKSEGAIGINEFLDDEGNASIKEGDSIQAYFLSSKDNEMLFTTRLGADSAGNRHLEDAFRNRIPVEGLVEKEIKGGFEVKIAGNVRAFCPYSQMGIRTGQHAEPTVGQNLTFHIIEYGEKGRNILVSHRAVLEEERRKRKEALRETLQEGMTVGGEITSVRPFGAFIDIGGIEGLIPVSEVAWGRVEDIDGSLSVGQRVDVVIKKLDWEKDKFSFSLKDVLPDPWTDIRTKYPEGSMHPGKVARLEAFGAFITLEPGIDGLVHISELGKGKRMKHAREALEKNQAVRVKIAKIDEKQKRLSLLMASDAAESEEEDIRRRIAPAGRGASGGFGTLGDMLRKKVDRKS
jgi:small subunit ribosomal protein S1